MLQSPNAGYELPYYNTAGKKWRLYKHYYVLYLKKISSQHLNACASINGYAATHGPFLLFYGDAKHLECRASHDIAECLE